MEIHDAHAHLDAVKQELLEAPYKGFAKSLEAYENEKANVVSFIARAGEKLLALYETLPSHLLDIIAVKMHADDAQDKLSRLNDEDRLRAVTEAIAAMAESAEKARVVGAGVEPQLEQALGFLGNALGMLNEAGMSLSAAREHSVASADARNAALQAVDVYKEII